MSLRWTYLVSGALARCLPPAPLAAAPLCEALAVRPLRLRS